jgi:hypothetical protein
MTTIETDQSDYVSWRTARWVAPFFAAAAFVLVPWIVVLAASLPATHAAPHWNVTWVGFDVVLTLLLIAVAAAAWRRSPWLEGAATAAAALLLVDAWFDVTTSSRGFELGASLAEALLVELPVAILCLLLARDSKRVLALSVARRSRDRGSPSAVADRGSATGETWEPCQRTGKDALHDFTDVRGRADRSARRS